MYSERSSELRVMRLCVLPSPGIEELICAPCSCCLPTRNADPAIPYQWWLCYASTQNKADPLAWNSLIARGKKAWICSTSLDVQMFFFLALMPGLLHQTFAKYFLSIKDWGYKTNYGLVPTVMEHSEQKTGCSSRWLPHDPPPFFLRKRSCCCLPQFPSDLQVLLEHLLTVRDGLRPAEYIVRNGTFSVLKS